MRIMTWAPPLLLLDYGVTLLTPECALLVHNATSNKGLKHHRNLKNLAPIGSRLKTDFRLTYQLGSLHRSADQPYRRAKRHEVKRADACQSTFPMRATRTQLRC